MSGKLSELEKEIEKGKKKLIVLEREKQDLGSQVKVLDKKLTEKDINLEK